MQCLHFIMLRSPRKSLKNMWSCSGKSFPVNKGDKIMSMFANKTLLITGGMPDYLMEHIRTEGYEMKHIENPTDEELKAAEEKANFIFNLLYNYEDPGNYSHEILFYRNFTPEIQRHVNSLWEELKIHGTEELWVHITSAVLVGTILIFAIYSAVVKKKRSKDYRMRDKALKATKSGNSN